MISLKIFFQKKSYFSSAFFYSCFSFLFSTWIVYIPYIAEKLNLTEGKIGSALFFAPIGSFCMIPLINYFINKFGIGKVIYFTFLLNCIVIFGPFLAPAFIFLCVALFCLGMATCAMSIAVNTLTSTIEKTEDVYIMSGSHGFFSAGGMIGAALGSFIAAKLHSPILHLAVLCSILLGIQAFFMKSYYYYKSEPIRKEKRSKLIIKPLIFTALVALVIMVTESAIADWSALYLKKIVLIDLAFVGFGYACFSFAMTTGRFFGDYISRKFGSWQLITYGLSIAIIGFFFVLLKGKITSLLGFTIVGIGLSALIPEIYRIAANTKDVNNNEGISFIAATANIGFMVGPVILGFLAEYKTLHFSFLILGCFVLLALSSTIYSTSRKKSKQILNS